jgi:hypothetical protein
MPCARRGARFDDERVLVARVDPEDGPPEYRVRVVGLGSRRDTADAAAALHDLGTISYATRNRAPWSGSAAGSGRTCRGIEGRGRKLPAAVSKSHRAARIRAQISLQ